MDFVLFTATQPSPRVLQMIDLVNRELASEGIGARWESSASEDVGLDVIERALVDQAVELIGEGWDFALLWATVVGGDGAAGVQVRRVDGSVDNVRASETLLGLLAEHKRVSYDRVRGTWLSGRISIADSERYRAEFSTTEVPEWTPTPTPDALRAELTAFPRIAGEIPDWIRRALE